ncbi:formate/nitrite transporter family protein [Paenibacillus arenosi]|uniref:Formate/nitrite transporter family protein n=1 Tax=Paenibacillus arenosi TaxID=2774142 RepID=A0ABR9B0V3_9BACL|nr:formate/nitrite transporter family protein [Paenibacillus arenosi]MBD8499949.1 formate/nitrite transporter family protein [Paenibacillus arenosi]
MFQPTIEQINEAVETKKNLMKSSLARYWVAAMLAGAYVGFGIMLIFKIGGPFMAANSPATSVIMGGSFGIALTLIIFAGAELLTGNNMLFTVSSLSKRTPWSVTWNNWVIVFFGNLAGAVVFSLLIYGTGIFGKIAPDHLLFTTAAAKMNMPIHELFFRGILCNWLVCLAIWTSMRAKDDIAKLVLIWWMLYAFIATGYEHSVANMSLLTLSLLLPQHPDSITWGGWLYNMIPVTVGNAVGGIVFVGMAYWYISNKHTVK